MGLNQITTSNSLGWGVNLSKQADDEGYPSRLLWNFCLSIMLCLCFTCQLMMSHLRGSRNYVWNVNDTLGTGATGAVFKGRNKVSTTRTNAVIWLCISKYELVLIIQCAASHTLCCCNVWSVGKFLLTTVTIDWEARYMWFETFQYWIVNLKHRMIRIHDVAIQGIFKIVFYVVI